MTSGLPLEQGSFFMGQVSWVLQGEGETMALWKSREGKGTLCAVLKEKHQSLQNIFLECCHHPSAGQQNSTVSYAERCRRSRTGNKSLLLSREVARVHPSLLLPVCLLAWSQTGEFIKSMKPNPSFFKYILETPQFQSPSTTLTNTSNLMKPSKHQSYKDENEKRMLP